MENNINCNIIIDFDSTFVKVEALEELAKIALVRNSQKNEILKKISEITNLGMAGEISFSESLSRRLKMFDVKRSHIEELILNLKRSVSGSFVKNKRFFQQNAERIYIISGGFKELIFPVVVDFGILEENVLANEFRFNEKDEVIGIDEDNFLAKDKGKVKQVKELGIKNVIVVGDGWTDYEIKKLGYAEKFIAFTENISRDEVVRVADHVVKDFDEIRAFVSCG